MAAIEALIQKCSEVADNPSFELNKHIAAGKKVIGVGPYYVPEELVYAAGAIPFGVWGAIGSTVEAKKYFPPFYCSICQMSLEMGLTHKLDKLSGMMITGLCDTLKGFSQNWRAGVDSVPMIYVSQPQNRALPAGREYAVESYTEVKQQVEECADAIIDDEALSAAIKLYNEWRAAMREFVDLAGSHPGEVSVASRVAVIDAGYYMDKKEHLEIVREINRLLSAVPPSVEGYKKVVLCGIYEDIPTISSILDENGYAVVADDLAKESRAFSLRVPETGDPLEALADGWCSLKNDSILFDPHKEHVGSVVAKAKDAHASGVVILLAKFCDPEEFEAPLVANACKDAGIPCLTVEIDQSTESYEQARTQLEAFADLL